MITTFKNTMAALAKYEAEQGARDAEMEAAVVAGDVDEVQDLLSLADASVASIAEAFFEDTQEYNSLNDCLKLDLATIKEVVKLYA